MANVNEVLSRLNMLSLRRFGEVITINGVEVGAIVNDYDYIDPDTGRQFETTVSITSEDAAQFQRGMDIVARGRNYKITHIPETSGPLIDIEVASA